MSFHDASKQFRYFPSEKKKQITEKNPKRLIDLQKPPPDKKYKISKESYRKKYLLYLS